MGTTTKQIAAHIEETREALSINVEELEQKIKAAADWRHHVRRRPKTLLGLAFGVGIVLATVFGSRSSPGAMRRSAKCSEGAGPFVQLANQEAATGQQWDKLKGAIVAAATVHLISYAANALHGSRRTIELNQKDSGVLHPIGW